MKDNIGTIIGFIIALIALALIIVLTKWIFETVVASDMPDWLKYVILR